MKNATVKDNSGKPDASKVARPVRGWGGAVMCRLHHLTSLRASATGPVAYLLSDLTADLTSSSKKPITIADTGSFVAETILNYGTIRDYASGIMKLTVL